MSHLPYVATATLTNGSAVVTGTLSAFEINVFPGDIVRGPDEKIYGVQSVESSTSMTLDRPYLGATVTAAVNVFRHSERWSAIADTNARLARIEESMARGYTMKSASSVAIGTGIKTFTGVESGLNILNGVRLRASSRANPANWLEGICTYTGTTITMTVATNDFGGAGTFTDWNINLAGAKGSTGSSAATPNVTTPGNVPTYSNANGTALGEGFAVSPFCQAMLSNNSAASVLGELGQRLTIGTIANGGVVVLDFGAATYGIILLMATSTGSARPALIHVRAASTPGVALLADGGAGAAWGLFATALTGTTGTDVTLNLGVDATGKIYIENRRGYPVAMTGYFFRI
ncbi:MAG: hypothetical protein HOO99_03880 [Hyphomicrobiaceae bacterium]|nr:hypothetical protein [Hyphomicrobiaceae bacterium]